MARQSHPRRSILLDLDGTLLNTYEGITKSIRYALKKVGVVAPTDDDLAWVIGPPLEATFAKLLGTAEAHQVDDCMQHYRERYEKTGLYESAVYPGIRDALEELVKVGDLFLATAKPQAYGVEALRHYELHHFFTGIYGSEFDGSRNEKPELIAYVLEREKLKKDLAIMVGDRKYDVLGAKANGIAAVGVTWGFGPKEELVEAGAHALCERAKDLPTVEKTLHARGRRVA